MTTQNPKPGLIYMIQAYHQKLAEQGIDFPLPDRATLEDMETHDLKILERELRDLARTPSGI